MSLASGNPPRRLPLVFTREEVKALLAGELAALSLDGIGEDKA